MKWIIASLVVQEVVFRVSGIKGPRVTSLFPQLPIAVVSIVDHPLRSLSLL
jgi:hypothetical protein